MYLLKLHVIWLPLNLFIPGKVSVTFGATILLDVCEQCVQASEEEKRSVYVHM